MPTILGIETSCDETAAAVVVDGCEVRSTVIASQHDLHQPYGGVVPEIASRAHIQRIMPVIEQALRDAGCELGEVDAVAVGNRPGLIGSLLVGVSAAASLAWALDKPLLGIDHVRAHLYAADMTADPRPGYPALGLVVSGGHTSLYDVRSLLELSVIGRTIDDAVGEAYDKAAVILDAGYPGGPMLDRLAQRGDAARGPRLPRSMLGSDSLDFSYSGLKTALLYAVRGKPQGRGDATVFEHTAADLDDDRRADFAAAFQEAAIDALFLKIDRTAARLTAAGRPPTSLLIGGGVSANSLLRRRAAELQERSGLRVCVPPMKLCVDNAAMIAGLAHHHLAAGLVSPLDLPAIATLRG
jgi:N6-L-threonylcarbamoyladenine synthase